MRRRGRWERWVCSNVWSPLTGCSPCPQASDGFWVDCDGLLLQVVCKSREGEEAIEKCCMTGSPTQDRGVLELWHCAGSRCTLKSWIHTKVRGAPSQIINRRGDLLFASRRTLVTIPCSG